ncbi:cysteine methyltransferase [Candidatus Methylacidiphilum fumarolicum]|uniref:methylated-DNA--[protein]-cysteine S-methyltransferase n=3 Tax=Candidatus Methylacidiphilum fumarolicum TaxID=591154 RepID=I0JYD8_METFB|nr:MGMT family protein [Candidatus Methylacidiphilum fumarolicum]TFE67361.1 cysteine methyltransferase [Candidatus Methylacidiphilum fumarolicum]TFE77030.1 cysteine methyltransferase [Candidatus Methylacidiphilum fumarolicum]CAI9084640.1 Methylated-DNA--[protein]-cysteine S-methyltransferase [Candidatus Methylacidiphilum fumarolicum]CCG92257.1 Methylated DNA-protein cysteine methyltransferase [Methylacidiphilum fumariolicum SolV]
MISTQDRPKEHIFLESVVGPVRIVLIEGQPASLQQIDPKTPHLSKWILESQRQSPMLFSLLSKSLLNGDIFEGELSLQGLPPFYKMVLERVKTIPKGTVKTYSQLAEEIGHPLAVRAVGSALAKNPLPLLIPCHRVIRKNGQIGHYSLGGKSMKEKLLKLEGFKPFP